MVATCWLIFDGRLGPSPKLYSSDMVQDPAKLVALLQENRDEFERLKIALNLAIVFALMLFAIPLISTLTEAYLAVEASDDRTAVLTRLERVEPPRFLVGESVQFKAGGPSMTAVAVSGEPPDQIVQCEWTDELGAKHHAAFSAKILTHVASTQTSG
jgi:uncharacterized protein YodC (DUF2158 family)